MKEKTISLCIPTNGKIEWVFPVLDSIYSQKVDINEFEVIVSDNGNNPTFEKEIKEYLNKFNNLIYSKNDSYMFHNQIAALKLGTGKYLKIINHRDVFLDGSLPKMIEIIKENEESMPVMYFSNGALGNGIIECKSFDSFVSNLKRYISWTTGVGIWRREFEKIKDTLVVDDISPHSCILLSNRRGSNYKIINHVFSKEIDSNNMKGTYDLFKAFGIEEISIVQNLYIKKDITIDTFKIVKNDYRQFVAELYWMFCILKKQCSYDLSGFNDAMGIYFNKYDIIIRAYLHGLCSVTNKLFRRFNQ